MVGLANPTSRDRPRLSGMKYLAGALALAAAAAVAIGLAGDRSTVAQPAAPQDPAPTNPSPSADVAYGTDGLTVRYLDADGSIKTVPVEDFRR